MPCPSQPLSLDLAELYHTINVNSDLSFVAETVEFIASTIRQFDYQGLILSFNGGKDCTVLIHLLCIAIAHVYPEKAAKPLENIHVIYFPNPDEFPEIEQFMRDICQLYSFSLCIMNGDFKQGLRQLLAKEEFQDTRRGIFMGQRRGDPQSFTLERLCPSDAGWPKFTRIFPILDWTYAQVWECLLKLNLPYCSLYSQGYTSLGTIKDTQPNPSLRRQISSPAASSPTSCLCPSSCLCPAEASPLTQWVYAHACDLIDASLERAGRFKKAQSENQEKKANNRKVADACLTVTDTATHASDNQCCPKDYRKLWLEVLQQLGTVYLEAFGPSHSQVVYVIVPFSSTSSTSTSSTSTSSTSTSSTSTSSSSALSTQSISSIKTLLVGFSLGCNTSLSETLCRDKKLTHTVLKESGINIIEHQLISGIKQVNYHCASSRWYDVCNFFENHNRDVVLKHTRGKSGSDVYRATNYEELEKAFCHLQQTKPSLVVTPFISAQVEVRVIVLPKLATQSQTIFRTDDFELFTPIVFRKLPLCVKGDGVSSLTQLCARHAPETSDKDAIASNLGEAGSRVLRDGEVWRSWMFNQALGASFQRVKAEEEPEACALALRSAHALGIWCCAVDVFMPQAIVLEVNTKIVTDILDIPCSEAVELCSHALRLGTALRRQAMSASEPIAQRFPALVDLASNTSSLPSSSTPSHLSQSAKGESGTGESPAVVIKYLESGVSGQAESKQNSNTECYLETSSSSGTTSNNSLSVSASYDKKNVHAMLYHHRTSVRRRLVESAFGERGFGTTGFDEDYVLRSCQAAGGSISYWNVNYDFGHVLSTEGDITNSKALCSALLQRANVPCVPHQIVYNPLHYDGKNGLAAALRAVEKCFPCVLKLDGGSGGVGVSVVGSIVAAESFFLKATQPVCLSPFIKIHSEYRCICVGGRVVLSIIKQRPSVQGDGVASVAELIARWAKGHARNLYPRLLEEWSKIALGSTLWTTPPKDEEVLMTWKHNLDYGAIPVLCEAPADVVSLAQNAARTLNLVFAAVDIVQSNSTPLLLEVNSCPMWTQTEPHLPRVASACVQAVADLVIQASLGPRLTAG